MNQIQNKIPLEYCSQEKHEQYSDELQKIIEYFSNKPLTDIDNNIINEFTDETTQSIQETTIPNISVIGSLVSDQRDHKWD